MGVQGSGNGAPLLAKALKWQQHQAASTEITEACVQNRVTNAEHVNMSHKQGINKIHQNEALGQNAVLKSNFINSSLLSFTHFHVQYFQTCMTKFLQRSTKGDVI